jgi:hypothetical protein
MIKTAAPKMSYVVVAISFAILGGMVTGVGITQDQNSDQQTEKIQQPVTTTEPAPQRLATTAQSGGPGTGFYCLPTGGRTGGVHDLGFLFQGQRVNVIVYGDRDGFDPVAIVRASSFDASGRDFFAFDDDSGGNGRPFISFIVPFSGTYILQVREFSGGSVFGCYGYRIDIFN